MSMEFWGAEVKSGEPLKVEPGGDDNVILHLSQAALGEVKKDKGNESVYLYVKVGDKKLVIGTLSSEKFPQLTFDLVFDEKFELSHNWKNGSVYFTGYKTFLPNDDSTDSDSDSDSEKGFQYIGANIEPRTQAEQATKPDATAAKQVTIVEPNKDAKLKEKVDNTDDNESESSDDSFTAGSSDEDDDGDVKTDEESDDDEESSEEDEDTSNKLKEEASKKRPLESAKKTPVADKKGKFVTPEKTDGKKGGGHVATPHPSKLAKKSPANNDQAKQQTPKSGGAHLCKLCNRSFSSEVGLQSHTKAKHSDVK